MITKVIMPKLGETMEEGVIGKLFKKEGDKIEKGEIIFELTTDKAVFEVEASKSGVIRKLLAKEGDTVKVIEPVAYISDSMDESLPVEEKKEEIQETLIIEKKPEVAKSISLADRKVNASPLAKRLAKEKGIDITLVKGSGPNGRILEKDVLNFKPESVSQQGIVKVISLSNMRKIIAQRLSKSKQEAPHYYIQMEINMTEVSNLRKSVLAKIEKEVGVRLSFNDFVIYAVAKALKDFPLLNSHFVNEEIIQFTDCNIGLAVSLDDGLVVPVIKQADKKSVIEIAKESKSLISKAVDNNLSLDDISHGTFTVSNMGMLKVDSFTAIINPPQVGILAIGQIKPTPVVLDDKIVSRLMMKVTLSADHRVIDGAYAAKFLNKLNEILQKPSLS
ncbi:MAG: dihydrolipoamide acetyltransferase family protein [Candidatus Firestonebacteria bacterium]